MEPVRVRWKDSGWSKGAGGFNPTEFRRLDQRKIGPFEIEIFSKSLRWSGASLHITLKSHLSSDRNVNGRKWYGSVKKAKEAVDIFLKEVGG